MININDMPWVVYNHSSEQMSELEDESIHLVVTSPPYPMISKWDDLFGKVDFEYQHSILDKVWRECYRVLINGGTCCINIGDATRRINNNFQCFPNFARVMMECVREMGFTPLVPIFWKKVSNRPTAFLGSGFLPPNAYVAQDCEYIIILRKNGLRKFQPKDKNRYKSSFTKEERDLWFQQIWNVQGARGAGKTSKFPKEIPYRLIRMFSVIGDTILDPFHGTGTTGEVTRELSRQFRGYDIDG